MFHMKDRRIRLLILLVKIRLRITLRISGNTPEGSVSRVGEPILTEIVFDTQSAVYLQNHDAVDKTLL